MSPKEEAFDWVSARQECSLIPKFEVMRVQAEKNAKAAGFDFESSAADLFCVFTTDGSRVVSFERKPDRIQVNSPSGIAKGAITLTLNDDGDCRYRIDGKGEYLCWQVLCRMLEPLFFTRT